MTNSPQSLPQVVGKNVRRLRGDRTLENVATYARNMGANWSSGSVSTIELGRSKCTVETLAILSYSLTLMNTLENPDGETVTIRDLLQSESEISLTQDFSVTADQLMEWMEGADPGTAFYSRQKVQEALEDLKDFWASLNLPPGSAKFLLDAEKAGPVTPGEKRQAKKADIDVNELRAWSMWLWQKPFEAKRDEIAGKDSTPQKKGRVSRKLMEDIRQAIAGQHRGDR